MSVILALAVWLSGGTTWFLPFVGYAESPEAGVGVMYPDCASVNQLGAAWYQDWTPAPPLCDEYSRTSSHTCGLPLSIPAANGAFGNRTRPVIRHYCAMVVIPSGATGSQGEIECL